MRLKNRRIIFLVLTVGLVVVGDISGVGAVGTKKEPTLQETIDWLTDQIQKSQCSWVIVAKNEEEQRDYKLEWYARAEYAQATFKITIESQSESVDQETPTRPFLSTRFQDTWRCVFKLKDFDPSKVQVRETKPAEIAAAAKVPKLVRSPGSIYEVHLDTTLEKETIQVERDSTIESSAPFRHEKKGIKETWSGLTLHFTDKALADRVAKAFAHVIRLNGILLALACVSR